MIDLEIEDEAWSRDLPEAESLVFAAANAALAAAQRAGAVVVLLTDDTGVQDLNSRFRGKDSPTNVLSFPAPETPRITWGTSPWPTGSASARPPSRARRWPTTCNTLWRTGCCIL